MYVLEEVTGGRASLDERLRFVSDDYEEGTGVLQGTIREGTALPVRELIRLSLSRSDNIATNMLVRRFGHAAVVTYARRLGVELHFSPEVNEASPRGMALLLQRLMDPKRVTEQTRRFVLDALVLLPGRPLAIAVLSEDVDETVAVERTGRVAQAAYSWARDLPPAVAGARDRAAR